jgi:hypothetical protein
MQSDMNTIMKRLFEIERFRDLGENTKIMRLIFLRRFVLCTWKYDEITEEWI